MEKKLLPIGTAKDIDDNRQTTTAEGEYVY